MFWERVIKNVLGALVQAKQISPRQAEQMQEYAGLLEKWNQTHNLTAIRDQEAVGVKHFLDSLALLPFQNPKARLLDVGSGAGFPGLVLAIAQPEKKITLIEKSAKKCAFLTQVKGFLKLMHVNIICGSVENHQKEVFEEITARAFSTPEKLIRLSQHLLGPQGRFLVMMGKRPGGQVALFPSGWCVEKEITLQVPQLEGERSLIVVRREQT